MTSTSLAIAQSPGVETLLTKLTNDDRPAHRIANAMMPHLIRIAGLHSGKGQVFTLARLAEIPFIDYPFVLTFKEQLQTWLTSMNGIIAGAHTDVEDAGEDPEELRRIQQCTFEKIERATQRFLDRNQDRLSVYATIRGREKEVTDMLATIKKGTSDGIPACGEEFDIGNAFSQRKQNS